MLEGVRVIDPMGLDFLSPPGSMTLTPSLVIPSLAISIHQLEKLRSAT